MNKALVDLFGTVELKDLSQNRKPISIQDDEKIYQTLKAGIEKLREMRHPNSKESPVCVMVSNPYAINIALACHGQYLDKHGVIKTRFIEKVRRFFGVGNE